MALASGFQKQEALDLLALSAEAEDAANPPIPNPPAGWSLVFDSPQIGPFDNKWQLWRRASDGANAVAVRGTILSAGSIFEDLISLMIKATGNINVSKFKVDYKFAADSEAGVHLGFALGALLLLKDPVNGILTQLANNQVGAGSSVYITGHSQGAAVATLIRSYLEYGDDCPAGLNYKTYIFAQPKPGNDHYNEDFTSRFSFPGFGYCVDNTLDWVPEVPFTLEFIGDIDEPNPLSALFEKSPIIKLMSPLIGQVHELVERETRKHARRLAAALVKTIARDAAPSEQAL